MPLRGRIDLDIFILYECCRNSECGRFVCCEHVINVPLDTRGRGVVLAHATWVGARELFLRTTLNDEPPALRRPTFERCSRPARKPAGVKPAARQASIATE